jgi:hypothetical protein
MNAVGIIAMAAKPYHLAHDVMVRKAAADNDVVELFVSLSDRRRTGEVTIRGSDMEVIWREIIGPTLPANVRLTYGGSPVGNVWKHLGEANLSGSRSTFNVYTGKKDLEENWPEERLVRYVGDLFRSGQIILVTSDECYAAITGTLMRALLAAGDRERFLACLPGTLDRVRVWDILSSSACYGEKQAPAGV